MISTFLITTVNEKHYAIVLDKDEAQKHNDSVFRGGYRYVLLVNGSPVTSLEHAERILATGHLSHWHHLHAPSTADGGFTVRLNPAHVISIEYGPDPEAVS